MARDRKSKGRRASAKNAGVLRRPLDEQLLKGKLSRKHFAACESPGGSFQKNPSGVVRYSGYEYSPGTRVERVSLTDLTPENFWANYVSRRKPVVISGHIRDNSFGAASKWTNEYMTEKAGKATLKVEYRGTQNDTYGRDKKREMSFSDFISQMDGGRLYLTTQEVSCATDGYPELFAEPLKSLAGDIPLKPSLLGSLVPQSINVWMGCSPEGSSSGLHHDFHDNLYILLRGKKRFRLYSPSHAREMYPHGKLQCVHVNGRIVYEGDGNIRADGAEVQDALAWEKRQKVVHAMADAQQQQDGNADSEAAMEAALDSMIDNALEDDDFLQDDDYFNSDDESPDPLNANSKTNPDDGEPPSFSQIDLQKPDDVIRKSFPNFPGKAAAALAEVEEGEMLFLPTGWFHEVTSLGGADEGGHLALNYWMHPPDNMDPSPTGFQSPYQHQLWPSLWEQRSIENINMQRTSHRGHELTEEDRKPSAGMKTARSNSSSAKNNLESSEARKQDKRARKQAHTKVTHKMLPSRKVLRDPSRTKANKRKQKGSNSPRRKAFGNVESWFSLPADTNDDNQTCPDFKAEDAMLSTLMAQPTDVCNNGRKKKKRVH